jgi:nicotinate-nucleotide--dimethylbenzimidazole phosphoribosyltransferase
MGLVDLAVDVPWPDQQAAEDFAAHHAGRRLGARLRELCEWLAGAQGTTEPKPPHRVRVVRFGFAPDAPPPATADDLPVDVRDISAPRAEPLAAGVAAADDEVDRGADLVVLAVARRGCTTEVLTSVLAGAEPVKVLPRGAALAPEIWMARAVLVRDARRRAYPLRGEPDALADAVADPDLAAAAALALRLAARRTPILLDGVAATGAALLAHHVQSRAARWWRVADVSEPAVQGLAVEAMGQRPLLDLGTGLDDGTAGLLAAGVLRVALGTAIRPGL